MKCCVVCVEAPWFDKALLQDLIVRAGQKINYTIPIEAAPRPTVKWTVNGKPIEAGVRADIQTFNNQTLFEILFSVRGDTGKYTLTLKNNLGECSASANVTVLGELLIIYYSLLKLIADSLVAVFFNRSLNKTANMAVEMLRRISYPI